jgi:hypothetical protein
MLPAPLLPARMPKLPGLISTAPLLPTPMRPAMSPARARLAAAPSRAAPPYLASTPSPCIPRARITLLRIH